MLRHSSKRMCPGYHGQPWRITGTRCWTPLTERRVPPLRPAPLSAKLASRPARFVLPTLHAQPQTYTTTRMSYGLVSCFKAASMSVGKKSPSLIKWVPGVEVDAASTSTTTGAGRYDKQCTAPAEIFLRRRFRCGTLRVRIADYDNTAGCVTSRGITPTPTPTLTPTLTTTVTATRGVPYAGSHESCASTTMRRGSFANRIGKMRCALPSPTRTCRGGTYSMDQSTSDGSGTTNTC